MGSTSCIFEGFERNREGVLEINGNSRMTDFDVPLNRWVFLSMLVSLSNSHVPLAGLSYKMYMLGCRPSQ